MASSKHAQSYQLKSLCKYAMPPVIFFSLPRKADTNNYIAEITCEQDNRPHRKSTGVGSIHYVPVLRVDFTRIGTCITTWIRTSISFVFFLELCFHHHVVTFTLVQVLVPGMGNSKSTYVRERRHDEKDNYLFLQGST